MAMVRAECPNCHREIEADNERDAAICPVCRQPYVVETAIRYRNGKFQHFQCPYCGGNDNKFVVNPEAAGEAALCPDCGRPYHVGRAVRAWKSLYRFAARIEDAEWEDITEDMVWEEREEHGELLTYLLRYKGHNPHVVVPPFVDIIHDDAFKGNSELVSVEIPSHITRIYSGVFQNCIHLEKIELPEALTVLGANAFNNCVSLPGIVIPEKVREIRENTFQNCASLTKVVFPPSLEKIERGAFQGCRSLLEVKIPDTVVRLGESAFQGCEELRRVNIPSGISRVAWGTFSDCRRMEEIEIPPNIEEIGRRAFDDCDSVESVVIPPTVRVIRQDAFRKCDVLRKVTISLPDKVEYQLSDLPEAEADAFSLCKSLREFDAPSEWKRAYASCADCLKRRRLWFLPACYIATCVYGSYDCPPVWTLRRFRDEVLAASLPGRLFIGAYYLLSPALVRLFGNARWFRGIWRFLLDRLTARLNRNGVPDTPYRDPD